MNPPGAETPSVGQATGHTGPLRAMHWATVALLLATYPAAWAIANATTSAEAAWLTMLHRSLGLAILALTMVRLTWRRRSSVPPLPADLPAVQRLAARGSVVAFYALLMLQPLLGLTASLLHGDRITVFGGVVIPLVLPVDRPYARLVFQVHGGVALLLLALIGLHVAAALYHHFVRRDEVLSTMLPAVRRLSSPDKPGLTEVPR
ncbi:MAG TPA: cytochrome b/b6 domain-containing protein [Stellaceae bacterium]|nr:cytochrome b/b6 domain-containing protein [Stellaceae bacterium]